MKDKNLKIGIIGLGFLGSAMESYFVQEGLDTKRYDKKGVGSPEEINEADLIFVCVNTPYDKEKKGVDLAFVNSAVETIKGEKIVVLRSTVPPGKTDAFQEKFPNHYFLFNPEFLRTNFAREDFKNPPRQIIGFTEKSKKFADIVLRILPQAPQEYTKILPAKSAELIKYASNIILASRVALSNKIFDFTEKLGIDYEDIKQSLVADPRIGSYGLNIWYDGFRGYNSSCFPKDIRTFISEGEKLGVDVSWLEAMDDENLKLLKEQGLEPDYGYPKK